jgi:hypothetical protein
MYWISYYLRNVEFRESANTLNEQAAQRFEEAYPGSARR